MAAVCRFSVQKLWG